MPEELDSDRAEEACWGEVLLVQDGRGDAPLGGLVTTGSSSEELSSDAPRMNFRRSLASGPELSIGALVLEGFWLFGGKYGFLEFASGDACRASVSVLISSPQEALLV